MRLMVIKNFHLQNLSKMEKFILFVKKIQIKKEKIY